MTQVKLMKNILTSALTLWLVGVTVSAPRNSAHLKIGCVLSVSILPATTTDKTNLLVFGWKWNKILYGLEAQITVHEIGENVPNKLVHSLEDML